MLAHMIIGVLLSIFEYILSLKLDLGSSSGIGLNEGDERGLALRFCLSLFIIKSKPNDESLVGLLEGGSLVIKFGLDEPLDGPKSNEISLTI